jgi:hypothetical protein
VHPLWLFMDSPNQWRKIHCGDYSCGSVGGLGVP